MTEVFSETSVILESLRWNRVVGHGRLPGRRVRGCMIRYCLGCCGLLSVLFCLSSCPDATGAAGRTGDGLYVGRSLPGSLPAYGDVVSFGPESLRFRNLFTNRDTTVERTDRSDSLARSQQLHGLTGSKAVVVPDYLTTQPFTYRLGEADYWASFESRFTGFPEYARPEALDFVNHVAAFKRIIPEFIYTEYAWITEYGRPLLLLSSRDRGSYLRTLAVVVDTITADYFSGRVLRDGTLPPRFGTETVRFSRIPRVVPNAAPETFVQRVNQGYSRSYLLLPPADSPPSPTNPAATPRRSLLDPGDVGHLSASFLDDSRFLLLSDDHIILEGDYVLDLDKGLLTIRDAAEATYHLFLTVGEVITLTLPVSVVELQAGRLEGRDNFLRIEIVR